MKLFPLLMTLIVFSALSPVFGAVGDADAQTKLTDGLRATSDPTDPAWLTLYGDASQLPRPRYALGDFCMWGVTSPYQGGTPTSDPVVYGMLKSAGILGVRMELPWNGLEQYQPPQLQLEPY